MNPTSTLPQERSQDVELVVTELAAPFRFELLRRVLQVTRHLGGEFQQMSCWFLLGR